MKGKRILINAGMVTSQPSGVGVYSAELLKELVPYLEKGGVTFTIYCYEPSLLQKINITQVKKISLGFVFDKLLKKKEALHRHIWNTIVLNFLSINFDIVYSFSSHGALFHRKQIITIHDLICLSFPNSHKGQYYYFKYFLPYLIRQSEHIISISNFTKNEVIKTYSVDNKKVSVIYNGINHLEKLQWLEKDENWLETITEKMPFCLSVGASYPHKNIETLLEVCKAMKHLDIKFIITNKPNPYYYSLIKKAEDLQLKNVIFLSYIDASKLALLYKEAKLNIYLSLYEGFGFPPAEAALFKTQSLLTKQPALIEVYGASCEYTDPFDINRIKIIISKYAFAPDKIETQSYYQLKQKYNWNKSAQETFNLLKLHFN